VRRKGLIFHGCNAGKTKISHVLRAIGVPKDYAEGTIRISLGVENSEEDVRRIVEALIDICSGKQSI
jgi:cysteine desulfurase